jgi:hypothetical protein
MVHAPKERRVLNPHGWNEDPARVVQRHKGRHLRKALVGVELEVIL